MRTFSMLLYQNGGQLYREEAKQSGPRFGCIDARNSNDGPSCIRTISFRFSCDFPNRFRTGEMPIGIADYTFYNYLIGIRSGN